MFERGVERIGEIPPWRGLYLYVCMGCEDTCRGKDHYKPFEEWKAFHLSECPSFKWMGNIPERRPRPSTITKRAAAERVFGTEAQYLAASRAGLIMDVDYDKTRNSSTGRYSWIPNEGKLK